MKGSIRNGSCQSGCSTKRAAKASSPARGDGSTSTGRPFTPTRNIPDLNE
jgi:hypothetical protein